MVNEACRYWHAAHKAAAIAVGTDTAELISKTASTPTVTQTIIANSKFKVEAPTKLTGKLD